MSQPGIVPFPRRQPGPPPPERAAEVIAHPDRDAGLVQRFLDHLELERHVSGETVRAYRGDLEQLVAFLHERARSFTDATYPDLRAFSAAQHKAGLSRSTQRRRVASLHTFYRWLVLRGHTERDEAALLVSPKVPQRLPRVPTVADVHALIEAIAPTQLPTKWSYSYRRDARGRFAPNPEAHGLRDRAILELLWATGVRVSELVTLTEDRLSLDQAEAVVLGKGGRERVVFLGEPAVDAIRAWRRAKEPGLPLWPSGRKKPMDARAVRWMVEVRSVKTLGHRLSPHQFRHAFATAILEAGMLARAGNSLRAAPFAASLRDVQELLGHASIATTERYAHVASGVVRHVYQEAHPRA